MKDFNSNQEINKRMGVNISNRKWDKLAQMFAEGKTNEEISSKLSISLDKMPAVRIESNRLKAEIEKFFANLETFQGN